MFWIPSYKGILEEIVDSLSKELLNSQPVGLKLPCIDLKSTLNLFVFNKWKS